MFVSQMLKLQKLHQQQIITQIKVTHYVMSADYFSGGVLLGPLVKE